MKTKALSVAMIFAVVYVVLNFVPLSMFIGGAAFITASILWLPILAKRLPPRHAALAGFASGLVIVALSTGVAAVVGAYAFVIVFLTAVIGSIAFHYRRFAWLPAAWLITEGAVYMIYYHGEATPLWLTHYAIGIVLSLAYTITGKFQQGLHFSVAMVENAWLNLGSIFILNLPAELWIIIFPVSFIERVIAGVGSYIIDRAVERTGLYARIVV